MKLSALFAVIPFMLAACGGSGTDASPVSTAPSSDSGVILQQVATSDAAKPAQAPMATAQSQPAPTQEQPTAPAQKATPATPAETTATVPAIAAPSTPVLVEYYGDSIIWGWLPNNDWVRVDSPAPSVFAADTGLTVRNMGSPGRLAENALAGDGVYPAWNQQMAQSKATHVIIEYHSHDTVANTTARVRQLIQIAKANGKKVVVETIGPGNHSGDLTDEQITQAQRDAAAAENVPVIDQTAYLKQYLSSSGKNLWDICADGLHPNPDVYVMKGHYAAKQFASMK